MVSRRSLHHPLAYGLTTLALAVLASAALNESRASNSGLRNRPILRSSRRRRAIDSYGRLPLRFEANKGQTDYAVKFLAKGSHQSLYLTSTGITLLLEGTPIPFSNLRKAGTTSIVSIADRSKPESTRPTVLRTRLIGSNPDPEISGVGLLPGRVNYLIGRDPKKWRTDIPTFAGVKYQGIYPGVDLIYHGSEAGKLEYDFLVHPGANPDAIELAFDGADRIVQNDNGDLVLHTVGREVIQRAPVVYQGSGSSRRAIGGSYALLAGNRVRFELKSYDKTKSVVIDPVVIYSTYLGGSNDDEGYAIATDSAGNAYVTGRTASANFPVTSGAEQGALTGSADAFVTKLNPEGTELLYSTYLGGSPFQQPGDIAVDSAGAVYLTGQTSSADFPVTPGAFETTRPSEICAFVTKLDPSGSTLAYSTYLGGHGGDGQSIGLAIAIDALGSAYVTGNTGQGDTFPTTPGAFQRIGNGFAHAFVTKFNAGGTALVYSTFLAGSTSTIGYAIKVDSSNDAYVAGSTSSTDFPHTRGAFQGTLHGSNNAFVTKLNAAGSALIYSTFLGGNNIDLATGLAVDAQGNAYVGGQTSSTNFPVTSAAFQTTYGGDNDAFVTKLNPAGTALIYSTYLGGNSFEDTANGGHCLAIDSLGDVYVTGLTYSTDFPVTADAIQPSISGGGHVFLTELNPAGSAESFSTYFGGSNFDIGSSVAVDSNGNALMVGLTNSTDFPVTAGSVQTTYDGDPFDAFVVKIGQAAVHVAGGGFVTVSGDNATFNFNVMRKSAGGTVNGSLRFSDPATGDDVRSVSVDTLVVSGNTATFSGSCTNNGTACTFSVTAQDNGSPGSSDTFAISGSGFTHESGQLGGGNIVIN